jgi:Fe2+ transport system protein FeoA
MNTKLSMKARKFNYLFIIMTISGKNRLHKSQKAVFFLSELQNKLCHLGIIADQSVRLIKQTHDRD